MSTNNTKLPMIGILKDEKESVTLTYSILERLEVRGLIRHCHYCHPEDKEKFEAGIYHPLVSWDILGEVLASDPNLGILANGRLKIWISLEYLPNDSDNSFDICPWPVDILITDDLAQAVVRWNELVQTTCSKDRLTLEEVRDTILESTDGHHEI